MGILESQAVKVVERGAAKNGVSANIDKYLNALKELKER